MAIDNIHRCQIAQWEMETNLYQHIMAIVVNKPSIMFSPGVDGAEKVNGPLDKYAIIAGGCHIVWVSLLLHQ